MSFPTYARRVLGLNLLVIVWGAFVRASKSGAGCGRHWPLCNGSVVPDAGSGHTMIEYAHRVTSGIALIMVIGLWWWSRREFPAGHPVRKTAALSVVFIMLEALLGGGLVLLGLVGQDQSVARIVYLALHLLNTFVLLGVLALTAHRAGGGSPWRHPTRGAVPWLLAAGLAAVLAVGMTGAIAALGDTLFPSASLAQGFRADQDPTAHLLIRLRVLHPVMALLTGIYLSMMVWLVTRLRPDSLRSGWGRAVSGLVLLQLGVGITNLVLLAPVALQLAHLLVADLLWISLVTFSAVALGSAPMSELAPAGTQPKISPESP